MLHQKKNLTQTKILVIAAIAVLLAACFTGPESTNSSTDSANSPQSKDLLANVAIPGISNAEEITFKAASKNVLAGSFDAINGSIAPKIEVPKATPLTASGWAILPNESRLPDKIIITFGNNNSLVAVVPVNLERLDVVNFLKNPTYKNSGWSATFNSSSLPTGQVVLKAWAYNAARKEASQLNSAHEVIVLE